MAEKRRGLGRGLGSLIPSQETGRPSDVFFPRGERAETEDAADAPIAEREKKSSDPAESMRRAQAGRRTGAAKRAPAKASSTKSGASSGAAEDAVESRPAAPSAKKPAAASRKTTASSSRATPGATQKRTPQKSAATSLADDTQSLETATEAGQSVSDSNAESKPMIAAAGAASSETAPDETVLREASGADSVPESVREDSSGNGVYVSHETVRSQKTSEEAAVEAEHATEADIDLAEVDTAAETPRSSREDNGNAEPAQVNGGVPRETPDEVDDSAEDLVPVPGTTFGEIPLDRIRPNPRQPRGVFDEDALDELITSIREIGVLQPVVVRRRPDEPGQYELIMGERRFRASKEAGKETIPAIVRETKSDDLLRDALLENLHRVDLNPLEEAAAYAQLLEDFDCTQEELSERIGRSRPQISNTIRLLKLPAMVQRRVAAGVLSSGHARALLGLNDGANMEVLAQRVVAEGLSVRATEEAVILLNRGDRSAVSRGTRQPDPELADLARTLGDRLDTRVNVVMGKRKGKLSVEFANGEDLTRILTLLGLDGQQTDEV